MFTKISSLKKPVFFFCFFFKTFTLKIADFQFFHLKPHKILINMPFSHFLRIYLCIIRPYFDEYKQKNPFWRQQYDITFNEKKTTPYEKQKN